MKFLKKGQMEMIGLVVIVILITLGMLFMATFAFEKEPKKKIFVRKGLAYSTMGALMKTEALCEKYEDDEFVGEKYLEIELALIEDCAESQHFGSANHNCGGNTCEFLHELIRGLLKDTLGIWGKHYEFHSKLLSEGRKEEDIIEPIKDEEGLGCLDRAVDVDSSTPFPISTDVGSVENILYICD